MKALLLVILLCLAAVQAGAAEACTPSDLFGSYGFQLSGTSTISGTPTPIALIGRLDFALEGKVSGYSSVNFNGLFLGNPVTGTYQFKDVDCSLTLSLQDDSGAFQHFRGEGHTGANEFTVHQTDAGAGANGSIKRVDKNCGSPALKGAWQLAMATTTTPLAADPIQRRSSVRAMAAMDGAGGIKLLLGGQEVTGSFRVDSDCFVEFDYAGVHLRGIIVNENREVLAVQTDPRQVAAGSFTAR